MSAEAKSTGKLGYAEYARIPDDGRRHEVIDGEHVVNPAPDMVHQRLSRRIQFQLYTQIELRGLGEVMNAPVDLQLSDWDIVQPDLVVVLSRNKTIMTAKKIEGSPDLVVEILSGSSMHNDRVLKKELYRKSGIPEYWVVDPEHRAVEQFILRDDNYELLGCHADAIVPQVIEGVRVDLRDVW
ncbi:MAG: Uma2 family endonuclease [Planctomycetes bacterium]|nr:Uma2 family endonuclease [Planctomycetota bacterium]